MQVDKKFFDLHVEKLSITSGFRLSKSTRIARSASRNHESTYGPHCIALLG